LEKWMPLSVSKTRLNKDLERFQEKWMPLFRFENATR